MKPVTESYRLLDARRLTGPNVLGAPPGAVLDVALDGKDARAAAEALLAAFAARLSPMLQALGWADERVHHRRFRAGISLAFAAPTDQLYTAVEVAQWAFAGSLAVLSAEPGEPFGVALARLRRLQAEEANPAWRALEDAAARHQVSCLADDESLSLGLGKYSRTWPIQALPAPNALDWSVFGDVPLALVTGTNGKTTTGRLAKKIAQAAGYRVGVSSTDGITVDERLLDEGDYSGPGGARAILRETEVELAILETARGGLLRRGLGVRRADVALITNIAEDHLGDFASQSLQELLAIKWVVTQAAEAQGGRVVLNADDELLVAQARRLSRPPVWFSLNARNTVLQRHREAGGECFYADGTALHYAHGGQSHRICRADSIPLSLGGTARHNIANALAAAAVCHCLGIDAAAIAQGLQDLRACDLPGRSNLFERAGVKILVDFAHNAHGVAALADVARAHRGGRIAVMLAQPGDRPDRQIRDYARAAWSLGPQRVLVSELAKYHRGREPGEVYALLVDEFMACGADATQLRHVEFEQQALEDLLIWSRPGDLLIVLALDERKSILARLASEPDQDRI